jgi:hypothetical protein
MYLYDLIMFIVTLTHWDTNAERERERVCVCVRVCVHICAHMRACFQSDQ